MAVNAYDINLTTFYLQTGKHIDQRSKDIVNYYFRNLDNDRFDSIPPLIICLCLIYYYQWDQFNPAQSIKLTNFDMTIEHIDHVSSSQINVFGTTWIKQNDDKIFIWTFNIEHINDPSFLAIGISSSDTVDSSSYQPFFNCNKPAFALLNNGGKTSHSRPFKIPYSNHTFQTGSVVQMRLNTVFGELSFIIDGISLGVAFQNIFDKATKFKMSVLLTTPKDSVTLQSLDYLFF